MIKLIFTALLVFSTVNGFAGDDAALSRIEAFKEVGKVSILRTEFKQVRKIDALTRPLVSKGNLILSKNDGLLWSMKTPFPTDLLITKEKMVQLSDDGEKSIVKSEDQPVLYNFSEIFMALFSGDLNAIRKNFEVEKISQDGDSWQVIFEPKGLLLGKVMKRVELSGAKLLETVKIHEANGDSTVISFMKTTYDQPETLTPKEKTQLQLLLKE